MAGAAGLEPTHAGVKVPCLTDLATPQKVGGIVGIEPTRAGATIQCVNRFTISTMLPCLTTLLFYHGDANFVNRILKLF